MNKEKSGRFEMVTPPGWIEMIDDWRAAQRPVPSRAEAIRRLVDFAMAAEPLAELMALAPPNEDFREWALEMIRTCHSRAAPD